MTGPEILEDLAAAFVLGVLIKLVYQLAKGRR